MLRGGRRHDKVVRQAREMGKPIMDLEGCVVGSKDWAYSTGAVFENDTAQLQGVSGL